MPGMGELFIILAIVLLIFGAGKLPQIGEGLGKAIRNFKRGAKTQDDEVPVLAEEPARRLPLPPPT